MTVLYATFARRRDQRCGRVCRAGGGRAVAGKLGRFQRENFQEFVPESFRWTDRRSRPGTNFSISEKFLCEIGQDFAEQPLYHAVEFEGFVAP